MSCANCAGTIERGLERLEGVSEATVNFAAEKATVSFAPSVLDESGIVAAIREVGYGVPVAKVELAVTGMTCANGASSAFVWLRVSSRCRRLSAPTP